MRSEERFGILSILIGIFGILTIYSFQPVNNIDAQSTGTLMKTWIVWLPLGFGFIGSGVLFWFSRNGIGRLVATLSFVFFFSSYFFFYGYYGSDVGGIVGILSGYENQNALPKSIGSYQNWPLFFILDKMISLISGWSILWTVNIIFLISSITLSFAFQFLFEKREGVRLLMPAFVFFTSAYVFLNWQASPQTLSFVILLLSLGFIRPGIKFISIVFVFFIFILFSHGFVSFWFIGTILILFAFGLSKTPKSSSVRTYKILFELSLIAELAFLSFYAQKYLTTFTNILQIMLEPSVVTGAPLPTVSNSLGLGFTFFPGEDIFNVTTKILAIGAIILIFTLILISFPDWFRSESKKNESPLAITGGVHLAIGSFLPILGSRGIQLLGAAISDIPNFNLRLTKKTIFSIMILIMLILPANIIRINANSTSYLDSEDIVSADWLVHNIESNEKSPKCIISSGEELGVLQLQLPSNWTYLQTRTPNENITVGFSDYYFLDTPEYRVELQFGNAGAVMTLENSTVQLRNIGNLIFDDGINRMYWSEKIGI